MNHGIFTHKRSTHFSSTRPDLTRPQILYYEALQIRASTKILPPEKYPLMRNFIFYTKAICRIFISLIGMRCFRFFLSILHFCLYLKMFCYLYKGNAFLFQKKTGKRSGIMGLKRNFQISKILLKPGLVI